VDVGVRADDRRDAARLLERLIGMAGRGEIEADSPAARRLMRRLEGAHSALNAFDQPSRDPTPAKPSGETPVL
jgi:hypothetical protein